MRRWQFRSYLSPEGDVLRLWYENQVASVQAEAFTIARFLRDQPAEDWVRPDYADLTKKQKLLGFGEIRLIQEVNGMKEHHRLLGYRHEDAMQFTILVAEKKSRRFDYDAVGLVEKRRIAEADPVKFLCDADWICGP